MSEGDARAARVAQYIRGLTNFDYHDPSASTYNHMGATITDAVLQAGISESTVEQNRVDQIRRDYPRATTSSGFLALLKKVGAETLLQFHGKKPALALALTKFFVSEGIETEADLKRWWEIPENFQRLKNFKDIGNKTAHYLGVLANAQTTAMERHLLRFLQNAGSPASDYDDAQALVIASAQLLDVPSSTLDYSIWRYMSDD